MNIDSDVHNLRTESLKQQYNLVSISDLNSFELAVVLPCA